MTLKKERTRRTRAALMLAATATALCAAAFTVPSATADPEPPKSPDAGAGVLFNCATYPSNQALSRSQVMARAQSWITAGVPYSQAACYNNQYGDYRTDCSGFVSMAWGLRISYDTSIIRDVATAIARADLQPGDMLWRRDADPNGVRHVALFVRWADSAHTSPVVWQESGPDGSPANEATWSAAYANTYTPYRYNNIVGGSTGSSLSGDGRAEIASVQADGAVRAWYNAAGFAAMPWGGDNVIIATGFAPATTKFADLDGDGKTDILAVQANGEVRAWRNGIGFGPSPWRGDNVVVATGVTDPARVKFADLDGDRRAEVLSVQPNGEVRAWHNVAGFAAMPWGGDSVVIATGVTDPAAAFFADLDADGKAEILAVQANGEIRAWHNVMGFAPTPWRGDSVIIATGFAPATTKFGDLDGDGKSEILAVQPNGEVRAWHNVTGFAPTPWRGDNVIVATGVTDPARAFFI